VYEACHADLVVDLARGESCVTEVVRVAVGGVEAAAGRNAVGRVIHTAEPTGVVVHAAAAQLERGGGYVFILHLIVPKHVSE